MDVEAIKKAATRLISRLNEPYVDNGDWCSATKENAKQVAQLAGVKLFDDGADMSARVTQLEEQVREKQGIIDRLQTQAGNPKKEPPPAKVEHKKHETKAK